MIDYGSGIYAVDAEYVRQGMAAVHLVVNGPKVAIVDTGTSYSLPLVEDALGKLGLGPEAVEYVLLTHVHLDHAGGAGVMMQAFPSAKLIVHPRGARHMINPSMLIDGATAVYGAEKLKALYGDILSVPADRVISAPHDSVFELGDRTLRCFDTPGHAKHHICIHDSLTGHIFTGDTFGISLRELDVDGRQFVYPATTPVQFEPDAMHNSINMLMSLQPGAIYLTHFGQVTDVAARAKDVQKLIDELVIIAREFADVGEDRHRLLVAALEQHLLNAVREHGATLSDAKVLELFAVDVELNAQGLEVWLDLQKRLGV